MKRFILLSTLLAGCATIDRYPLDYEIPQTEMGELVTKIAAKEGVDTITFHRLVRVSSNYNEYGKARYGYGMGGITLFKAQLVGYNGEAIGLFDAETNLTYSAKYLRAITGGAFGNCAALSKYENDLAKDCTNFGASLLSPP